MNDVTNTQLITDIRELLSQARLHVNRTVNHTMVHTYWHVGRIIVEHEQSGKEKAEYGKQQLTHLSKSLFTEFGKGFDVTNLRSMRRFYLSYPNRETLSPRLTWSHYRLLLRIDNEEARKWYAFETGEQGWSVRALERQINKLYYERLLSSKEKQAVKQEGTTHAKALQNDPKHYLRDPYILEFLNIPCDAVLESDIETALTDNLKEFLLELGKGFAFVERQQRIKTDGQDFAIDLVFYNYKLKCFVLVDIKVGQLTHQDVGQMDTYVRIYDEHKRDHTDNPTVGLILCSKKSEAIAKYSILTDSKQIFASKYLPHLPSESELVAELMKEMKRLGEIEVDDSGEKT